MIFYKTQMNVLPKVQLFGKEHLIPPVKHFTGSTHCYVLYFLFAGKLSLINDGQLVELLPGDTYLFNIDEHRKPVIAQDCEYFYIHFQMPMTEVKQLDETILCKKHNDFLVSIATAKEYDDEIYFPKRIHVSKSALTSEILKLCEKSVLKNGMKKGEYFKTLSAARLVEILVLLYREYVSEQMNVSKNFDTDMVDAIVTFLESSISVDVTRVMLEEKFGYQYDYLNRKFKAITEKTIFEYLREVRISAACMLLTQGGRTITNIAEECGYCDVYYFSRAFKKQVGVSPKQYKTKVAH